MNTYQQSDYFDAPNQERQLYVKAYNELQQEFPNAVLPIVVIKERMEQIQARDASEESQ